MIAVRKSSYDNTYSAYAYAEDEPTFDEDQELKLQAKLEAGTDPYVQQPRSPHTHFGPGGERVTKHTYLLSTYSKPSIKEAVNDIGRKTMLRAAKKRVERAQRKLEYELSRLKVIEGVRTDQRVFIDDEWKEITQDVR